MPIYTHSERRRNGMDSNEIAWDIVESKGVTRLNLREQYGKGVFQMLQEDPAKRGERGMGLRNGETPFPLTCKS